ncbi:hypothetical protein NYE40_04435 [Paenibacillus sp. FSL W8-1187]|uniref:hypothetical protein n=1 Tax=Paenibacillus sp. FSL W8-1187 TaxID=2975339 RepID=UPI0030D9DC17
MTSRRHFPDILELRHGGAVLELEAATGRWIALRFDGEADSVLAGPIHVFDAYIEGRPLLGSGRRVLGIEAEPGGSGRPDRLLLAYEEAGIAVVQSIQVADGLVRQSVELECRAGGERLLTEIRFTLPDFIVGDPAECLLQLPGQIAAPDSPYAPEAKKRLDATVWNEPHPDYPQGWLESAPDQTSGLIAVENRTEGRIASAWMFSEQAVVFPTIDGTGERLTAAHRQKLTCWLRPGVKLRSGSHGILLTRGSLKAHLARFRSEAYGTSLACAPDRPAWLRDARLLQIDARPLPVWTKRLPRYRELGFNTLYLLPVWQNQGNPYALIDHYRIDDDTSRREEWAAYPEGMSPVWNDNPFPVGSEQELKAFVAYAHELGFKVLFDLIPQGIGTGTAFSRDHAEWLSVDELGRPRASHGWGPDAGAPVPEHGTYSMDWGSPDYRRFIIDWAMWNLRTFGIDGFRTDAMHWKEANLRRDLGRPAWETTFGGVRLIEELRAEMKREFPETALIGEVWGPIFQRGHDATYENGWLLGRMNTGWLTGRPLLDGRSWTRHLSLAHQARPDGAWRAAFGANHDLERFVDLAKSHPLADAVSFVHLMTDAIPFVWYKELEKREPIFALLLRERDRLSGCSCRYDAAEPSSRHLFTALWTKPGGPRVLAAANLSEARVASGVRLPERLPAEAAVALRRSSDRVAAWSEAGELRLELPAGGWALVELPG